jgi:SOS response regulatory protein OraA/RecX
MNCREQLTIEKGYELALKKLAFADYTAQEMTSWLKRRGYAFELAQAIVAKLLERNYINDARLCSDTCEHWEREGKYGEKLLKYKLMQRGFAIELVEKCLADIKVDEYSKAKGVFLAYLKKIKKIDEKTLPKIFRHMAAKGFPHTVIAALISDNKGRLAAIDDRSCLDTYFKRLYN